MERNEVIAGPKSRPQAREQAWARLPQVTVPVAQAMQRHSGTWKSAAERALHDPAEPATASTFFE
jgi:hypothetical protein